MNDVSDFRVGDRVVTIERDRPLNSFYGSGNHGIVVPRTHGPATELSVMMDNNSVPIHQHTRPDEIVHLTGVLTTLCVGDVVRSIPGRGQILPHHQGKYGYVRRYVGGSSNEFDVRLYSDPGDIHGDEQFAYGYELVKVDRAYLMEWNATHPIFNNGMMGDSEPINETAPAPSMPEAAPAPITTPPRPAPAPPIPDNFNSLTIEDSSGRTAMLTHYGAIYVDGREVDYVGSQATGMPTSELLTRMLNALQPRRLDVHLTLDIHATVNTSDEEEARQAVHGFGSGIMEEVKHRACEFLDHDSVQFDIEVRDIEPSDR